MSILSPLLLSLGINWIAFGIAAKLRTEKFYDLTGSLTFIALSLHSLRHIDVPSRLQMLQAYCVFIWTGRLGLYLFTRILRDGKDKRFDEVRENPKRFFVFWTLQALWVYFTLLPSLYLWRINDLPDSLSVSCVAYFGFCFWCVGFVFETVADFQKDQFKRTEANNNKFITSGLWSLSRHPNYFGEIMMWSSLWLTATSVCSWGEAVLLFLCPLFDALLLLKLSGVPILESQAQIRWGNLADYQIYVKQTPILIPNCAPIVQFLRKMVRR